MPEGRIATEQHANRETFNAKPKPQHTASQRALISSPFLQKLLHCPQNCRLAPFAQCRRGLATESQQPEPPRVSVLAGAGGAARAAFPGPHGRPPPRHLASRAEPQHRLHLWETGAQCSERESIYSGENIFVLQVKGSHFQQFNALFAGPGAGVAARGLFFEAEQHIMRLLTDAPCHPAKNQNGYLSINLTLHPLHFICLNKFGG